MKPTSIKPLLDGSRTPGLYLMQAPKDEILAVLGKTGWHAVHVEGDTLADFHASIAAALGFPPYYGHNLDALLDGLRELTEPTALVWTSWHEMAIYAPDDWGRLVGVLSDRTCYRPGFAVVFS